MRVPDLTIAGILAAITLPFLVWNSVQILRKGEIFLTDDFGKVTAHYSRQANPIRYWLLVVFNLAMAVGFAALAIWAFIGPKNSN